MGCASGTVKYLVFIFNLVFAVAGMILLIAGIMYQLNINDMKSGLSSTLIGSAPMGIIAIGAIIFIISFFGCCGAIKESTCMLTTYAITLLVIFILQLAIGIFYFLQINDNGLEATISKDMEKTFERAQRDDPAAKDSFFLMQQSLKCCGVNGPSDWRSITNLPASCCENNKDPCYIAQSFHEGCARKVYNSVKDNISTIGYIAIGLCATELIAAIFSLCLSSAVRNERRRGGFA